MAAVMPLMGPQLQSLTRPLLMMSKIQPLQSNLRSRFFRTLLQKHRRRRLFRQ